MLNTEITKIEIYEIKGVIKDLYAPAINGKMLIDIDANIPMTYYGYSIEEVEAYCERTLELSNRDILEDDEDAEKYKLVKTIEVKV